MVAFVARPGGVAQAVVVVDVAQLHLGLAVAGHELELASLDHGFQRLGGQAPPEVLGEEVDVRVEFPAGAVGTGIGELGVLGRLDRVYAARGEDTDGFRTGGRGGRGEREESGGDGQDGLHGGISFQFSARSQYRKTLSEIKLCKIIA